MTDTQKIYDSVKERYSSAAQTTDAGYGNSVAKSFGYTEDELTCIPNGANLGLSCGNPVALASLREGETVIDLGSGAGFDCFLAAKKVGSSGKVYGIDMNQDMLVRANEIKEGYDYQNIEFVEAKITEIPLDTGLADCVISNCVINLVPETEKQLAFSETFRLLKAGGRLAISDILLRKQLPDTLRSSMALYTGCIAGASQMTDYEKYLKTAGFHEILIKDTNADLNVYVNTNSDGKEKAAERDDTATTGGDKCCKSTARSDDTKPAQVVLPGCCAQDANDSVIGADPELLSLLAGQDLNQWAGSFKIFAVKQ